MIKQDSYTKANESGEEAQKETMGPLQTLGSLRVKIKLTVRPGSKVKYNEGKYKLTKYKVWYM